MSVDLNKEAYLIEYYFPKIIECHSCKIQYKCICLYDNFHYICLGCGSRQMRYHPPYKEKIIRNYCVKYAHYVEWYRDTKLHNENGPAVEFTIEPYNKLWYIDGNRVLVESNEELLNSIEYKKFKLKAFL